MESITETDLIITVIVGTLMMFVLVTVIVWAVIKYQKKVLQQQEDLRLAELNYQSELLSASIKAADREREAVSMNIHDEIGASLNVVKLNLAHIPFKFKVDEELKTLTRNNELKIDEILAELRAIYSNIGSPSLRKLGFMRGLESICKQIGENGLIKTKIEYNGLAQQRFDPEMESQLYRLSKEVLNNIIKHAQTAWIEVTMIIKNEQFVLEIRHEGKELMDADVKEILKQKKGLGLKSIFARMQVLGGEINYIGTLVSIRVPLKKLQSGE
jgi:two-component system NarL family sensor kinase